MPNQEVDPATESACPAETDGNRTFDPEPWAEQAFDRFGRILANMLLEQSHCKLTRLGHIDDPVGVPEIGNRKKQEPSWAEHTRDLGDNRAVIFYMFNRFRTNCGVEARVAKRQLSRVGLTEIDFAAVPLGYPEEVQAEVSADNHLSHAGDIERVARIRTTSDIENGAKFGAVVSPHIDHSIYDWALGAKTFYTSR